MISTNLQTIGLRRQLAQMQVAQHGQQAQQSEIDSWRQIVFESRKILDSAERELQRNPLFATYSSRVAQYGLSQLNEADFPALADKEALYAAQGRALNLVERGEALIPELSAQAVHRLAWLHRVRTDLNELAVWLEIEARVGAAPFLFFGRPTFFRGFILFLLGNGVGGMLAGIVFHVSQVLGVMVYFLLNGITLVIVDHVWRRKLLAGCNFLAQTAGGWVGPQLRLREARSIVEQARGQLSRWNYQSPSSSHQAAAKELEKVDGEISQLQEAYFLA